MYTRELSSEVLFAQEQVAHERKVIEAFMKDPMSENVVSVTLEVSGVEHIILIHDEDFGKLAHLLLKFNKKESVRLEGKQLIQSATDNRALSYSVGWIANIVGGLNYAAAIMMSVLVLMKSLFDSKNMEV